jgi:UDP-2,3-diacylglucosamine hydrolase
LYNLVQHGTKVTLFAGNHDYWAGKYLAREVGLDLEPGGRTVEHQGVTMFIHHGDGFYPGDRGYRLLKRVLRSRIAIALFRLLHPDAAAWVARITSRTSRKHLAKPDFDRRNIEAFRAVADRLFADGYGAVVFGHAHVPLVERRPGGTLVVPGDWIAHNTYVLLENGTFTLHSWPNE